MAGFGKKSGEQQGAQKAAQSLVPIRSGAAVMETGSANRALKSTAKLHGGLAMNMPKVSFIASSETKFVTPTFLAAKTRLIELLLEEVDFNALEALDKNERQGFISERIDELMLGLQVPLTAAQQTLLKSQMMDEVLGFGPLEPLLSDPEISDIMVNGPKQVYIEKEGKIFLSDVTFTSEKHLINVIQRIVSLVGRRVDETSPMVDARMPDGSRFNAIIPPLALDGSLVSIRKFKKNKMPLSQYVDIGSASPEMVRFLEICAAIRLNILVSGGTGSGKTTLLNALSGHIDIGERVVTIEDAAELQMHQPHVLRLETRPSNMEGRGEIGQRPLVKNALRMRPDRIILGEIRGDEVIDVLQAMNTGHDGSMATIHANNPRDCLSRLENLVSMSGVALPLKAMRGQIASSVQLIVQTQRLRDGSRKITHIEEITGLEDDTIKTRSLFRFKPGQMDENGRLQGEFITYGIKPQFIGQAEYFGRADEMLTLLGLDPGQHDPNEALRDES